MIYTKCQLCENDNTRPIKKEHPWEIVQCRNCGFVYVNPRPDEEYLTKHYQSYLPLDADGIDSWKCMMSGVFSKSLDIIENLYHAPPGKLLDIGCGYGFFLEMAEERGWKVSGIDLSEQGVLYAASRGLNVSKTTLFEKAYNHEEFDVVTMFYVLEHLLDPLRHLREVHRILKPKGLLLLRIPHTTPIVKMLKIFHIPNKLYDAPSHLSDFSPLIIRQMLPELGFVNIRTMIGGITYPGPLPERFASCFFGGLATVLNKVTFGKYLLPGVSKTTIAQKGKT